MISIMNAQGEITVTFPDVNVANSPITIVATRTEDTAFYIDGAKHILKCGEGITASPYKPNLIESFFGRKPGWSVRKLKISSGGIG